MSEVVFERFSRKVTIFSFVLAIFIMYIHAKNLVFYDFGDDISGTPLFYLNQILSEVFGRICVPFFFIMSGYWMFRFDLRHNAKSVMKRKLKKKIFTLGAPYLIWNTIGFLFFLTITHIPFLSATVNGGVTVQFNFENIFKGIFLHEYYYSFWFMQDLIVLTAISPIILLLLRNRWMSYVAVAGLMLLHALGINKISSLMLFLIGGILAVYHRDFFENPSKNKYETVAWCLLFVICSVIRFLDLPHTYLVMQILCPIIFWKALDFLNVFNIYNREPSWFCKQSFFIYAAHIIPVDAVNGLLSRINNTMMWASITYILNPLIVLLLLYIVAKAMNKLCPRVYALLCGNRS